MATLPSPLAAAIGIVPAVLDGVLRLPVRAIQLPLFAVSTALSTVGVLRREYDDLVLRGERLVGQLRGETVARADELEDRVEDLVGRTPFATAYDRAEDALEDAAHAARRAPRLVADATEQAAAQVAPLVGRARNAADAAAGAASDTVEKATDATAGAAGQAADATAAADTVEDAAPAAAGDEVPAAETPKGGPTPKAVDRDSTRVDTAASPSVVDLVDQAAAAVAGGAAVDHDALPLPDYDHMTLGSLRGRLRALSVEQLLQIRTYEKAHADRLPVVTMLDNRIAKLATDAGAAPSGPVSTEPAPEQRVTASAPATISPATTNAPPVNPPSQGVPTNPAQPR